MRILQVISHGYAAGGAEKSALIIRDELESRGHTVKILSADSPDRELFSDYIFATINPRSPLKWLDHLYYRQSHAALRRAVADLRPDVIHFHTLTSCSPSVLFATGGVPAVLTIHGPEEFTAGLVRWFLAPGDYRRRPFELSDLTVTGRLRYWYYCYLQRPIYRAGFRRLAKVIAPSQYILEATRADFAGSSMIQIYNGIPLPDRSPFVAAPKLLFVGRLERVKGVDVLLRAVATAKTQLPNLHLEIVGEGPQRAELEALAAELGLAAEVNFAGWVAADAIAERYAAAGALVIPSVWPENLPTVCLEAMASGLPVIGTATGGIPELIADGRTGLIVPVGDAGSLAAAIVQLGRDPKLMRAMSDAATTAAQRFSVQNFGDHLEQVYREITR